MGASPLLDATGDYADATSRIGVNGDGWVAKATMPYLAGQTFDPSKISLNVTDPGYDAAGATTVSRTITGRAILRRQYTANTARLQSNDGVSLTVYFSLSDDVFQGSTIVGATAAAGFYGASAPGATPPPVNGSGRAYDKPLFAWLNLQHERATGAGFDVEAVAYHRFARNGRQVARIEFIASDASSQTAATQITSAPALSSIQTKGNIVEAYKATIPLSALTQADLCQVNARVYPWIGDSSAVLDLSTDGVTWPTAQPQTKLRFLNDKAGTYGGAIAYVKVGATGGSVSLTDATARAAPFPTINAALAAVKTFNAGSRGHNDHSGADIYLMDDGVGGAVAHTPTADMDATTAGLCWTNLRKDPSSAGAVTLKTHASNQQALPSLIRVFADIDQYRNFTSGIDNGNVMFAVEGATLTTTNALSGIPLSYRMGLFYQRNVTYAGTLNDIYTNLSGFSTSRTQCALALGVLAENATTDIGIFSPYALIGSRFKRHNLDERSPTFASGHIDSQDGKVIANNLFRDVRTASALCEQTTYARGVALVQNVLERAASPSSNPALFCSGDGSVSPVSNIVLQHNTFPGADQGGRLNICYTDDAASAGVIKRVEPRFNLLAQWNCKTDMFTSKTTVTGRVGNWRNRYTVGQAGNVVLQGDASGNTAPDPNGTAGNFLGEAWPAASSAVGVANVSFADDKSGSAGAGSGAYSLAGAVNAAYGRVPSGFAGLAYDIAGVARRNDGSGASGAYERTIG